LATEYWSGNKGDSITGGLIELQVAVIPKGFSRWFLFRRCLNILLTQVLSILSSFCSSSTSLETMDLGLQVSVGALNRGAFNLPNSAGDYEVRSWTGWRRHVTLVLAAGAFLSVLIIRKLNH